MEKWHIFCLLVQTFIFIRIFIFFFSSPAFLQRQQQTSLHSVVDNSCWWNMGSCELKIRQEQAQHTRVIDPSKIFLVLFFPFFSVFFFHIYLFIFACLLLCMQCIYDILYIFIKYNIRVDRCAEKKAGELSFQKLLILQNIF